MSVDLTQAMLEIDGTYLKIRDTDAIIDREANLKDILLRAMAHIKYEPLGNGFIQEQLSPEEVGKRYDLIKKIRSTDKECDFSHEEKTLLRTKLAQSQHIWIAGQAIDMLKCN